VDSNKSQLIVYGFLWIAISVFKSKLWNVSRWKNIFALALLLVGFSVPATPYMKCTGKIFPPQLDHIKKTISFNNLMEKTDANVIKTISSNYNTASISPRNIFKPLSEIINTIGENLMWFFLPFLIIGLCYHFQDSNKHKGLLLLAAFIFVNITMMILRYYYIQSTVSKRWSLPLVVFTIFYIPDGLRIIESWLNSKRYYPKQKTSVSNKKQLSYFVILFLIGIGICIPKLLRPVRIEKKGYRQASHWLRENIVPADIIATSDKRITFYADLKSLRYTKRIPKQAEYAVSIEKNGGTKPKSSKPIQEKYSVWVNKKEKKKRIVIYEVL